MLNSQPVVEEAANRIALDGAEACRVCGNTTIELIAPMGAFGGSALRWFADSVEPPNARGNLVRCSTCGIALRQPCLSNVQLSRLYAAMKGGQYGYPFDSNPAWVAARAKLLSKWSSADSPSILDVGCYEGRFLSGLPGAWEKFGIEPSAEAQVVAREADINIVANSLDASIDHWRGAFDAACLFDVFEHLTNPADALDRIMELLKPGGILLGSTLDFDALLPRLVGEDHWYFQTPQHITFGSPRFVSWYCRCRDVRLTALRRLPHQEAPFRTKAFDFVTAISFRLRRSNRAARFPLRILCRIPTFRYLIHKQMMPSTFSLSDHFLFEIQKR